MYKSKACCFCCEFISDLGKFLITSFNSLLALDNVKNINCLNSKLNTVPVDYVSQIITKSIGVSTRKIRQQFQ